MFLELDPRTLGFIINFVALCLTALAVLLWRTGKMYPGFGRWTIGRLIGAISTLFSVQIGTWPHSVIPGGIFAMLSGILALEACRQFIGLKPSLRWAYVLAGALTLHVIYIDLFVHSLQINYLEVTVAMAVFHGCAGMTLLANLAASGRRGGIAAGVAFLFRTMIDLLRVFYFAFNPGGGLVDSSGFTLIFLLSNLVYEIVVNFSFFLMHYERVLADKAEEVNNTVTANKSLMELRDHLEDRVQQRTAELVRSQKLESVARLAGGVAHDFNNILMVINGYSGLILAQLKSGDPMYDPVQQIAKAGERAAGITRQLLAFSRQQKDDPQTMSLTSLLMGMMDMLRRLIGEDIEIVLKPDDGDCNIRADKGQVEQVVMNLAINARDAMPGGGKLLIETAEVSVAGGFPMPEGSYVVLSVTDTGVGMSPEVQARIFEPFFTTKGHDGTGLGLSTTYGIIRQSGGTITVDSTPGFGTRFQVYFPCVAALAHRMDAEAAFHSPRRGSETILLVEDQPDVRQFLRDILAGGGYHVIDASGGDAAIALAQRYPATIHLLITDMVLPKMNGPEIVNRVRFVHPGIHVLMMSGYTAERLDGQLDGNTPYLQKPFTSENLLKKVREILDAARSEQAVGDVRTRCQPS